MTFSELEQVCSNAGSLLCAAAYGDPETAGARVELDSDLAAEADLVARRTGDGFRACLKDRENTIITWPWDHLATRVAWGATRAESVSERSLGDRLFGIAAAYALRHRDQLGVVLDLWGQVVVGLVAAPAGGGPPNLLEMARQLLRAFDEETGVAAPA